MDATTNNPELAGCPICGRKPAERHANYWTGMRSVISMYRYECNVDSDHKISVSGKTDEEAIAAWNRRRAAEAPAPSEPVAYVRTSELEKLKSPMVAGVGMMLHKEQGDGMVAVYLAAPLSQPSSEIVAWRMVTPEAGNVVFLTDADEAERFRSMDGREVRPLVYGDAVPAAQLPKE